MLYLLIDFLQLWLKSGKHSYALPNMYPARVMLFIHIRFYRTYSSNYPDFFVTLIAALAPGCITPITGMESASCSSVNAAAAAVLHATTSAFNGNCLRNSTISNTKDCTSSTLLGPYGQRLLSPI